MSRRVVVRLTVAEINALMRCVAVVDADAVDRREWTAARMAALERAVDRLQAARGDPAPAACAPLARSDIHGFARRP